MMRLDYRDPCSLSRLAIDAVSGRQGLGNPVLPLSPSFALGSFPGPDDITTGPGQGWPGFQSLPGDANWSNRARIVAGGLGHEGK